MCNRDTNCLIILGAIPQLSTGKIHQRSYVYNTDGICPTICSTDYKDPKRVLIESSDNHDEDAR